MDKKIKVVHWINITRLHRCHQTFENDERFTHYFLVYPLTRWRQNFNKPNTMVGNVRQVQFLKQSLDKIKPDVVITTNLIDEALMKLVKSYCKYFIYVHHAIWSDEIIEQRKKETDLVAKFSIFDKIFCVHKEADMFLEMGMDPNKLHPVRGVIYFDEVRKQNFRECRKLAHRNLVKAKDVTKFILFIHNTGFHCRTPDGIKKDAAESTEDYRMILRELIDYAEANNCHIISKIKKKSLDVVEDAEIRFKLHMHPRVTVVRPEEESNLSQFLFADAVILQGYGTSYIETLLVNPRIAPCFIRAEITFNTAKYSQMPIISNLAGIRPTLDDLLNNRDKWNQPKIQQQISEIISDQFGGEVENVTEAILLDIKHKLGS